MDKTPNNYLVIGVYAALALAVLAAFWQVKNHDFVDYDDLDYVTENRYVQAGLTVEGVRWAFATGFAGNWHPLTWLSHMLDCQLFGANPAWHHLTNLLLHIINTLLLFAVLRQMTGALWQSAFVAAAFALHPLHVESVAWISERKDLLSGFFWILTMAAYLRYVKHPDISWYVLALLGFVLGLMTKAMLVTLPFVLLLLDYWPLGRFQKSRAAFYHLVREKIPFFVLSVISSIVTLFVERNIGSVAKMDALALDIRIANAPIAYVIYIMKMIWPGRLAALYPYRADTTIMWRAAAAGILLLVITILIIRLARNHKYLLTGWLWFLGTLVPVIGLVQVGAQTMADRYTYIPLTGLFVIVAWGLPELLEKLRFRKIVLATSALVVILVMSICTWFQTGYWRNSITLFEHALEVTNNNSIIHYNLASTLQSQGRLDEAVSHFHQALQARPDFADAYNNLGNALLMQGKLDEAISQYRQALLVRPDFVEMYYNIGLAVQLQGKLDEAISHYRQALQVKPDYAQAHNSLGMILQSQGKLDEAISHFRQGLQAAPDNAEANYSLGLVLKMTDQTDDALKHFRKAVHLKPDHVASLNALAQVLVTHPDPSSRDIRGAIVFAERATKLTSRKNAIVLNTLALTYAAAGQLDWAITTAQEALDLASADNNEQLTDHIRKQLKLYRQAKQ